MELRRRRTYFPQKNESNYK